jgi:hypothetical protein
VKFVCVLKNAHLSIIITEIAETNTKPTVLPRTQITVAELVRTGKCAFAVRQVPTGV